jgi:hypothetical protein
VIRYTFPVSRFRLAGSVGSVGYSMRFQHLADNARITAAAFRTALPKRRAASWCGREGWCRFFPLRSTVNLTVAAFKLTVVTYI